MGIGSKYGSKNAQGMAKWTLEMTNLNSVDLREQLRLFKILFTAHFFSMKYDYRRRTEIGRAASYNREISFQISVK